MPITRTLGSLTLGLLLSVAAIDIASAAPPAKLVIPKPTAPSGQAYSPHAVVAKLAQARFKVLELYRKGQAYAIVAIGPTGNKVQMTVDGASGAIVGMAILRRAHRAARPAHTPAAHTPPAHTPPAATPPAATPPVHTAANTAPPAAHPPAPHPPAPAARPAPGQTHAAPPPRPTTRYADDTRPFGAVIPVAAFRAWTAYKEADWRKPAPRTIPVTYSYAPYREALPSTYYVALPNQDAFAVAPPNYTPYAVYDPTGAALNDAYNAANDAEYRAMLSDADANYQAARANLAEDTNAVLNADNELLRNQLAAVQDQPPPVDAPPPDQFIAPDPGENIDTIPDVPPPMDDLGPGGGSVGPDDTTADPAPPIADNTVAPVGTGGDETTPDSVGGDTPVAPTDTGGDNTVTPPDTNGGDNTVTPPDNNGGDNTVTPPDTNGGDNGDNNVAPPDNNGGDNNVAPPDNNGGDNGDNNVAPPDNNGGDNNVAPPDNNGGDNGDNNVAPPDNNGGGDDNSAPPPDNGGGGDDNAAPPDNGGGDNGADNGGGDNGGGDNGGGDDGQ